MPNPLKLLTIGDSISQGFMSLAAARTDLCYSSIIAREMGWDKDGNDYHFPRWPFGGHPVNLEDLFRKLEDAIGDKLDTFNLLEGYATARIVGDYLDKIEAYYEEQEGNYRNDYAFNNDFFHNIAVRGFTVSDAWTVSYDLCNQVIDNIPGTFQDDFLAVPSASFFRTAARVLSPKPVTNPQFNKFTAIDWLKHHSKTQGIENLFLWLGANNVLSTVLDMEIRQSSGKLSLINPITPDDNDLVRNTMYKQYRNQYNKNKNEELILKCNMSHPDDFKRDYTELLNQVDEGLNNAANNVETKAFIGNIPYVNILPIARGMGQEFMKDNQRYFEYYTYFFFDDEKLKTKANLPALRLSEIMFIENTIKSYNYIINDLVKERNNALGFVRYHVVDFADALSQMAFRRNNGVPQYVLPDYISTRYPVPDTRYYQYTRRQGIKGGIFSLDGVHPTAIGQGLIAYEFLKVMNAAGVDVAMESQTIKDSNGNTIQMMVPKMDWEHIYENDDLYKKPVYLVSDIFEHDRIKRFILDMKNLKG